MDFPAKELRLVILGLKKLLAESQRKLTSLSSESDEFTLEANDAALIELMINRLEEEYRKKHSAKNS